MKTTKKKPTKAKKPTAPKKRSLPLTRRESSEAAAILVDSEGPAIGAIDATMTAARKREKLHSWWARMLDEISWMQRALDDGMFKEAIDPVMCDNLASRLDDTWNKMIRPTSELFGPPAEFL